MQCQLSPQGEADVKRYCDGAKHTKRQKAFQNTRSLSSFGFTKVTDSLNEQLCCRGLIGFFARQMYVEKC